MVALAASSGWSGNDVLARADRTDPTGALAQVHFGTREKLPTSAQIDLPTLETGSATWRGNGVHDIIGAGGAQVSYLPWPPVPDGSRAAKAPWHGAKSLPLQGVADGARWVTFGEHRSPFLASAEVRIGRVAIFRPETRCATLSGHELSPANSRQ